MVPYMTDTSVAVRHGGWCISLVQIGEFSRETNLQTSSEQLKDRSKAK